jgi:hypothetical protein
MNKKQGFVDWHRNGINRDNTGGRNRREKLTKNNFQTLQPIQTN